MNLPYPEDAFLLGHLLEVNRDAYGWKRFMSALLKHFNFRSCHIMVMNNKTHAMRFHIDAGIATSDEFATAYINHYIQFDEIIKVMRTSPVGKFYATNMLPKELNIYENDYHLKWTKPQGIHDGSAACIFSEGDWNCIMANNRSLEQGPYTQEEIDRLNALLPFIEKSVQASFLLSEKSKDERRAKAIANTYRIPVAVLTEYGELWTMNKAMEVLIANSSTLQIKEQCLHLENLDDDKHLTQGIIQASKRAVGINIEIDAINRIHIDDGTTLSFQELIDSDEENKKFIGVLVYALSKELLLPISENRLTSLFSLTKAEATICRHLITGKSLKEMAALENKSIHTAREQLNNAFLKTGCSSQVSLVNLLASIPGYRD
jgi:DNA-binding CsgD family transcriptional regulator